MTYDRAEIINTAWTKTRDMMTCNGYARLQLREVLVVCLKNAWSAAKSAAALLARSAANLWAEIQTLENRTRLDFHGQQRLRQLSHAYDAAKARE